MKRTAVLLQQHAGRMFRAHWKVQGQRVLTDTGALKSLQRNNIEYEDANKVVAEKPKEKSWVVLEPYVDLPEDKTEPYFLFNDGNVLVGGLAQTQVFCNALVLPSQSLTIFKAEKAELLPAQDKLVKRCIRSSLLFDAYQEKLPKRKDPEREAWNFARDFGITDKRGNRLVGNRLIQLCLSLSPQLLAHRKVLRNSRFIVPFEREGDKVVLDLRADSLILSTSAIEPPFSSIDQTFKDSLQKGLPDIYPMSQTISIEKSEKLSSSENFHPINDKNLNVHTALIYHNPTEVANLYDIDITEDQLIGRVMMKSYAFAVSQARLKYGEVGDLPEPVTVQTIQTDSKNFYFSIFQLNSISCHSKTDLRNFFWVHPKMPLFDTCEVVDGRSVLSGYNPSVFKTLMAFFYSS